MTDVSPSLLDHLVEIIGADVDDLMRDLEAGDLTAPAWREAMARVLARGHLAGYMTGAGTSELTSTDQKRVLKDLTVQLGFLDKFSIEVQEAAEFQKGWNARAQMYAEATNIPFWQGVTRLYPLPYMPGEGTQCLSNCGCLWEIDELDGEGNADAYWRRGADDSCATCIERERANPTRIRDGVLL